MAIWAGSGSTLATLFGAVGAVVALVVLVLASGTTAEPLEWPGAVAVAGPDESRSPSLSRDRQVVFDRLRSLERSAGLAGLEADWAEETNFLTGRQEEYLAHIERRIARLEGAT